MDGVPGRLASLCQEEQVLLWVDLESPTSDELTAVANELRLDPRCVAFAHQANRLPMVRVYADHYLVTMLAVDLHEQLDEASRIRVIEIDLLIGHNFLVSMHKRPIPFWKDLAERTDTNPRLGGFDAAYLLYVFMDGLLDAYAREFNDLEHKLEALEERLLEDPTRDALRESLRMKRHIQNLRHLVAPHIEAFSTITAPDSPVVFQHSVDAGSFRDLTQRLGGLIQRLDHARDLATAAHDTYTSAMSYRTNEQLKVLTFLSAMLLPMTVVTGMFGTNFALSEYNTWEPFYLMLAFMGALALCMLIFFRTRKWL